MRNSKIMRRVAAVLGRKKTRFVAAGILNTVVDFTVFNIAIFVFGLRPWVANIISSSIAMVVSFFINKHAVFQDGKAVRYMQFIAFVVVTAVGVWGLQTLVVIGASALLRPVAQRVLDAVGQSGAVSWAVPNVAKVLATVLSAIWNYLWYDRVVFVNKPKNVKLQEWM